MSDKSIGFEKKIGILGGTFDPIHVGHLSLAEAAREQFKLDRVWFMPSHVPPFKKEKKGLSDDETRFAMTQIAIASNPYFELCEIERERDDVSYTSDTLEILRERYPDTWFFFIMGQDCIFEFPTWHKPDVVANNCTLLAAMRGDKEEEYDLGIKKIEEKFDADIRKLSIPRMDISSTAIRDNIACGKSVKYLISDNVYSYIKKNNLYTDNESKTDKDIERKYDDEPLKYDFEAIDSYLNENLKPSRCKHIEGVTNTAVSLAMANGYSLNKAKLAGMLHDVAKNLTEDELLDFCKENHIEVTKYERRAPYLLHAKVGAKLAEDKFNVRDFDVLNAIRFHTTGREAMSLLEKIIFVADFIEPNRNMSSDLPELRYLAFNNLDECIYRILKSTLNYLKISGKPIDIMTEKAYNYYKDNH